MSLAAAETLTQPHWWNRLLATVLGRSGSFLLLSRVIQMGNGFALSVVLIKEFGLSRVGTYTVAAVAISALSLLCSVGLPYSLPREQLNDDERNSVAAWWAVMLIPLVMLTAVSFGLVMGRHPGEWIEIALFAGGGYFFGQTSVLNTLLLLQHKTARMIVPPLVNSAGIAAGAMFSGNMAQFAAILIVARACGNIGLFLGLQYAAVSLGGAMRCGFRGLKYSPMDMLAMASEQTGPLLIAGILTRAELGIYGLCQQFVGAADTPGWSLMQSHYPELVRTRLAIAGAIRSRLMKLSFAIAFLALAGAALLGQFVYQVPGFLAFMAVLTLSIPSRYLNNFYDQTLRAAGCIRLGTYLAASKFLFGLALFWILAATLGLWGCIAASVLLSVTSAVAYRYKALPILKSGQ